MFQFELHPHTGEIRKNFSVCKRWGNKTCRSTSNKQSWAFWFVKKWTSWQCGIGLNILLPTAVPFVCLSYCRPHGSEYHYDITVSDHTKCFIPHRYTFGLLSHHGRLGGGGLRRKPPLDGATDLLSKIWQHITIGQTFCDLQTLFIPFWISWWIIQINYHNLLDRSIAFCRIKRIYN